MKECTNCKEVKDLSHYKKWNNQCKKCLNYKNKQYRLKNKEKIKGSKRASDLKAKFGISVEEYSEILNNQEGVCAICKSDKPDVNGYRNNFPVDHCHKTGKIRGLLCDRCNRGLGFLRDDTEILKSAILYLEKSNEI